ncbi:MAG: prepilin-type N-terminal cleavage/methylation domain-containing protein [Burkholderiales bacterium]|nr:prepilin-type N-terminal cleavage/methylation domain-containing protein [Burkholderiales bacterium]OJX06754.1 MAG: type II secretion system protein G [Burkholderiales bacterium 70-64]
MPARRGFTLIELLVVLAIVATLLSLVAPHYLGSLDKAREAVLRENLATLRSTIDKYYADTGRYPETLEELVERRYLRAVPEDPVARGAAGWIVVPPPKGFKGAVFDVKSGAEGVARDGRAYGEW